MKEMGRMIAMNLLVALLTSPVISYPNGAPLAACPDMTPQHPKLNGTGIVSPQTDNSVYSLTHHHHNDEDTDHVVEVTLTGPVFRGFLVQAQSASDPTMIVGEFEVTSGSTMQYLSCPGNGKATVTHTGSYAPPEDHEQEDIHHEGDDEETPHPDEGVVRGDTGAQEGAGDEEEHHVEHHPNVTDADEAHHVTPQLEPSQILTLHWKPGTFKGDVIFKATVVQHKTVFWVGVTSDQLASENSESVSARVATSSIFMVVACVISAIQLSLP